jgi:hypothetical protein
MLAEHHTDNTAYIPVNTTPFPAGGIAASNMFWHTCVIFWSIAEDMTTQ